MLVATVLRRLGTLRHLVGMFLERGLPADAPRVETALLIGAAQILFWTCRTTPRSISACGWCRRTAAPRAIPA